MTAREVVRMVLDGKRPPYVPWNIGLTLEARQKLERPRGDGRRGLDRALPRATGVLWGMSTQRTLPYGSVQDVREETERLLALGREGGDIFAPAHDVEGDVPLENMLAFLDLVQQQPGYMS
jgi:hypothetical protein